MKEGKNMLQKLYKVEESNVSNKRPF